MKKIILLILLSYSTFAQVGINATGTAPASAAMLDVSSTNKGVLVPRMNAVQKGNIPNKVEGLMVYDTDAHQFSYWTGSVWVNFGTTASIAGWTINGNAGNELKNTNTGGFWSADPTGLSLNSTDITNPPTAPTSGVGTRMMWIPSRSAFRVGTVDNFIGHQDDWNANNVGIGSFATGWNTKAQGFGSTAMGGYTSASGIFSTALGVGTTANGLHASAFGYSTTASGEKSTAMGSHASTNGHLGSFIIHDNINENVFGITSNSLDNQMVMKFDGGFGFYSGGATDASMGFEKTIGLSVYGKGIRAYGGGNIYTENGGKIGVNTATPNATLQVNGGVSMPIKRVTGNYTVQDGDYTIVVDAPGQTVNIYLPSYLTNVGRVINIITDLAYSTNTFVSVRDISGSIEYYKLRYYQSISDNFIFVESVDRVTMQCGGVNLNGWVNIMNNYYENSDSF